MIQSNCAELLFLIGCVLVCGSTGNFIQNLSRNNKPFFVIRMDDIIGNGSGHNAVDDRFIFTTKSLPKDPKFLPTLSNGHVGFSLFSQSVHMNAFYNGHGGLSHRARIPNFSNIQLSGCGTGECKYTFNTRHGYFMVEMDVENEFSVTHLIYAHRYYNRAIVNQFYIQRTGSRDDIRIKIHQKHFKNDRNNETQPAQAKDDLKFIKNETIRFNETDFQLLCGHIMEKERLTQEEPIHQQENVCVLWNHVPEEITLGKMASSISYKFVMAVDIHEADVRQEMIDVFNITNEKLLISHITVWKEFWNNFRIEIDGDDKLLRAIISSTFNIACNLPSETTNLPQTHPFYGLSPTGLGLGDTQDDYEGHNFWDTEIFIFPVVALINHNWGRSLLHYRYIMLNSARAIAKSSGYEGARFPWESAATGFETIQPGYEYIAEYQQHITGDISFAMRQYFALSNDLEWARSEGCEMAQEIAKFWESRVTFNETIGQYEIDHVMGPDEDHCDTKNNVYTNVIAVNALQFGSMMRTICKGMNHVTEDKWLKIADNMKIIYDDVLNYHPQYEGYNKGMAVKQADTILIGYPLLFPMNDSTRRNDLNFYVSVTRKSGPAMTYSMFAINYLDIGDLKDANEMLDRSYKPYIRGPFNVWNEVVEGEDGAVNFITGAGGFLQIIFNGFFGIRINLHFLEIKNPRLPSICRKIHINGISYLNSKLAISVKTNEAEFTVTELKDELFYFLEIGEKQKIFEGVSYTIPTNGSVKIQLK